MPSFAPGGDPADQHRLPDNDFREALIQAMDDFANDTHTPAFDGPAILRRTRRRRTVLTVAASAAAVSLTAGAAFAVQAAQQPSGGSAGTSVSVAAAAPSSQPSPTPGMGTPSPTPGMGTPSPTPGTGTPSPTPGMGTPSPTPGMGTPSPGSPVASGTPTAGTGFATPSAGPDTTPQPGQSAVTVPQIVGLTRTAAEQSLAAAGLRIDHVQDFTDWKVPAGSVIGEQPAAGIVVAPGTAVTVFVSTGKP